MSSEMKAGFVGVWAALTPGDSLLKHKGIGALLGGISYVILADTVGYLLFVWWRWLV